MFEGFSGFYFFFLLWLISVWSLTSKINNTNEKLSSVRREKILIGLKGNWWQLILRDWRETPPAAALPSDWLPLWSRSQIKERPAASVSSISSISSISSSTSSTSIPAEQHDGPGGHQRGEAQSQDVISGLWDRQVPAARLRVPV